MKKYPDCVFEGPMDRRAGEKYGEKEMNQWLTRRIVEKRDIEAVRCVYLSHPLPSAKELSQTISDSPQIRHFLLYSLAAPMESGLVLQLGQILDAKTMGRLFFDFYPFWRNNFVPLDPVYLRCRTIYEHSTLRHQGSGAIMTLRISLMQNQPACLSDLQELVPTAPENNVPRFNAIADSVLKYCLKMPTIRSDNDRQQYKSLQKRLVSTIESMKEFLSALASGNLLDEQGTAIVEGYKEYQLLTSSMDVILYDQNRKDLCFGRISCVDD